MGDRGNLSFISSSPKEEKLSIVDDQEVILVGPNDWPYYAFRFALAFWFINAVFFTQFFPIAFLSGIFPKILSLFLYLWFWRKILAFSGMRPKNLGFKRKFRKNCTFVLHHETPLMKFAFCSFLLCATVLLVKILFIAWKRSALLPNWLVFDAFLGMAGFFLFWYCSECLYRFSPGIKDISYLYRNAFFRERRSISREELLGISVSGKPQFIPFLRSLEPCFFEPFLLFSDGIQVPLPSLAESFNPSSHAIHDYLKPVSMLAELLQCPLFPPPIEECGSFRSWLNDLEVFAAKSKKPDETRKILLEAGLGSITLEYSGGQQYKVDFSTHVEAIFFFLVLALMVGTLVYGLSHEWSYLAANPRFFYLILLDCTSILAATTGVWRWLIEEYWFLDFTTKKVGFFSRVLFFRRETICAFSDISRVYLKSSNGRGAVMLSLEKPTVREVRVSDWMEEEGPLLLRAWALATIVEKPCPELGINGFDEQGKPARNETVDSTVFINSTGMRFKQILPGSFTMGSKQRKIEPEYVPHKVTISKIFFMGIDEVTQGQYEKIMGENPSEFLDVEAPVENVTWNEAVEFCRRLSQKDKREYRLPTEAEWEYSCRAGADFARSWGGETIWEHFFWEGKNFDQWWEGATKREHFIWEVPNSRGQTHPVGRLRPNPWGLYDMLGNVREWCSDNFGPYPAETQVDPKGPPEGKNKVIRGGSFRSNWVHRTWDREDKNGESNLVMDIFHSTECCPNSRAKASPDYRASDLGFRVVLEIQF